jgi:hypothetical protein
MYSMRAAVIVSVGVAWFSIVGFIGFRLYFW